MSKEKMMTQVTLESFLGHGSLATMTTWIEASPKIQPGTHISLKSHPEPKRKWRIAKVYETRPYKDINEQKWDNNI